MNLTGMLEAIMLYGVWLAGYQLIRRPT